MSESGTMNRIERPGEPLFATVTVLAHRLQAVETALSDLQRRLATLPPAQDWVEQLVGSCAEEPAFEEAMALGRALRLAEPFPEDLEDHA